MLGGSKNTEATNTTNPGAPGYTVPSAIILAEDTVGTHETGELTRPSPSWSKMPEDMRGSHSHSPTSTPRKEAMAAPQLENFARLHHGYWLNPGIDALTPRAETLWTRALAWCDQNMTDGHISPAQLKAIGRTARDAGALVDAGLWSQTLDGWQINDYEKWAPTAEAIKAKKRNNARRQRKHRERNALRNALHDDADTDENRTDCEQTAHTLRTDCEQTAYTFGTDYTQPTKVNRTDLHNESDIEQGESAFTKNSNALRNALVTRPNTTQHNSTQLNNRGGGVTDITVVDETRSKTERATAEEAPPDRCPRHAHLPDDQVPPCHACKNARLEHEAIQESQQVHHRTAQAQARRAAIEQCSLCDSEGWLIDRDTGATVQPAQRCTHTITHTITHTATESSAVALN